MITGRIFDLQRFSLHDGPGIRTTVFLQGCPLRCRWCHNPESLASRPALFFTPGLCLHCGACVKACPEGVHDLAADHHHLAREHCLRCGACATACPTGALELSGREVNAPEVLAVVRRDQPFYDTSGGGMTLSGGEPLSQPEFVFELLTLAKAEGLHTVVDTSGHVPWSDEEQPAGYPYSALLPLVDLWLYDLKHMADAAHRAATGVGNDLILASLRRLNAAAATIIVRVPLIPGYNDTPENLRALGTLVAALDAVTEIHLLPYHRMQEDKYRRLGLEYPGADIEPTDETAVATARELLLQTSGKPVTAQR